MAIFGKEKATEGRAPQPRAPVGALSIIGSGMTVRGDLGANGVVKIEGLVEGNVRAASQVLVAKGGNVQGDVETAEAVIGGTVSGAIHARDRVEVQAGAAVHGDITTRRISVAEGGTLNGLIRMGEASAEASEEAVLDVDSLPGAAGESDEERPLAPLTRVAVPPPAPTQP